MKTWTQLSVASVLAVVAVHASADVTFYENENFEGRAYIGRGSLPNLRSLGFNDRASSVVVTGSPWEVCDDRDFGGQCMVLRPGSYPSLRAMAMNDRISSARAVDDGGRHDQSRYAPPPPPSGAQVTFYSREGFRGRTLAAEGDVPDFGSYGMNDRAGSVVVRGGERWEACEDANFRGRCTILGPGSYADPAAMGLDDRVASVRIVPPGMRYGEDRNPPPPAYGPRPEEQAYQVNVSAVHAVYTGSDQRCWVDREQVVQDGRSVGGAIAGGIVGGIVGHQIGGGTGRDLATVGGAVAGAAIGSRAAGTAPTAYTQDVQRCESVPRSGQPDYWDVTYYFQGTEHHTQMATPPGPSITVDAFGEPRM